MYFISLFYYPNRVPQLQRLITDFLLRRIADVDAVHVPLDIEDQSKGCLFVVCGGAGDAAKVAAAMNNLHWMIKCLLQSITQ